MNTVEMWKGMLLIEVILIILSFMLFAVGSTTIWVIIGLIVLIASSFIMFRQGQGAGHAACSVSHSLERVAAEGRTREVTPALCRQAWSVQNGVKSIFLTALPFYVINAVYIICMLLKVSDVPMFVSRLASFLVTMPYWPIVAHWHETFTTLSWDIVLVLMLSPFLLPTIHFAGYMTGPKLWQQTEKAMADGRRRAKARSRIVKKNKNRGPKPLI